MTPMTRASSRSHSLNFLTALSLVLLACGGSTGDGDGDGDGDVGDPCDSAVECAGSAICDPSDNTCQDDVSCTDHPDCGNGGNCNMASGICEVSVTGSPCTDDAQCQRGEACVAGDNDTGGFCGCDGEQFEPMPVTPNMLIVFDKSGSMGNEIGGVSKFNIAKDAVESLVTDFDGLIRFGMSFYPVGTNCTPGAINEGIAPNNGANIVNSFSGVSPAGSTPIGSTLAGHLGYAPLQDPMHPNYILLMTDGAEMCGTDGPQAATDHFDQGTRTFVVGFGAGVDSTNLNEMAQNGGTARMMGGEDYFQADDAQELEDAFNTIGGQVLSCSFQLDADADAIVRAFFDGSEQTGFTFDPESGTITFTDPAVCDELQGGNVDELVIVNSCPLGTD
jgi:D-amino-acid dehydrogenase/Ca-activated chloride channel family protein